MNRLAPIATLGLALLSGACGYRVSGRTDALPKNIKTIAIPAFENATTLHRLAGLLPADITREFIARTRYRVVTNPDAADAVLKGIIQKYYSGPATLDNVTGRASSAQIVVSVSLTLTDRATGKVIYARNLDARERYEISPDTHTYFEETEAGLGRLSRSVAREAVTAILEKF
jgi:outer membrane lipopolysaccharide assembly protein LptE/RlpB